MSTPHSFPSSRRQLFRNLGAATLAVISLPGCEPRQRAAYAPTFFTPAEWAFVNAASARLTPADDLGPGAVEAGVPEYIDRQMGTAWAAGSLWYMQGPFDAGAPATMGYQSRLAPREIWRSGIAAADGFVHKAQRKSFAQLAPHEQDAALHLFETGQAQFEAVPARLFFSMLLQGVREGFFADPVHGGNRGLVGWKLIGFPGARADFMDWVDRDVAYPLPPVAISGERGQA